MKFEKAFQVQFILAYSDHFEVYGPCFTTIKAGDILAVADANGGNLVNCLKIKAIRKEDKVEGYPEADFVTLRFEGAKPHFIKGGELMEIGAKPVSMGAGVA